MFKFYFFQYTCGRGKENDIVCVSLFVSRRHCIFLRDSENLYVTDLRVRIRSHSNIDVFVS